jgi:hypothetical protein
MRNLVIACAGAASDAKLMSKSIREALREQPGDEAAACTHADVPQFGAGSGPVQHSSGEFSGSRPQIEI